MSVVGSQIRAARKDHGIAVQELAERVGLSYSYLAQLERGNAGSPSEGKLRQIAEVLGIESDNLILAAGKIPSDIRNLLLTKPELLEVIRSAAQ